MKIFNKLIIFPKIFLITGGLLVTFLLSSCTPTTAQWDLPVADHYVKTQKAFEEIWSISPIYMRQDDLSPMISVSNGRVFFLGSLDSQENSRLIALDALNGELLWKGQVGVKSNIVAASGSVYIGGISIGSIGKYNGDNGDLEWIKRFWGTNSVLYLTVVDDYINAYFYQNTYRILDGENGNTIKKHKNLDAIFLFDDSIFFSRSPNTFSLQASQQVSRDLIWESKLPEEFFQVPLFTDDMIYVRSGEVLGSIFAVDRNSGKLLWNTNREVISNIVSLGSIVAYINQNGKLIVLNPSTGKEIPNMFIEFEPSPFILNVSIAQTGAESQKTAQKKNFNN